MGKSIQPAKPSPMRHDVEDSTAVVTLSPAAFRFVWCFILSFHLFNALFAAVVAMAHLVFATPAIHDNMWMLAIDEATLLHAGRSYVVVACAQIAFAIYQIFQSIKAGELSFGYGRPRSPASCELQQHPQTWLALRTRSTAKFVHQMAQQIGKHSDLVEIGLQTKQFLEIFMQTYQADQMSRSVIREDLNLCVVVAIFVNCAHTSVIDWALHRQYTDSSRLVLLLLIDIVVDFIITVAVPICIFVRRTLEYDFAIYRFPIELTNNDIWIASAISEGRHVMVTSTTDYISSLWPHLMGMAGLVVIKSILRRRRHSSSVKAMHSDMRISPVEAVLNISGPTSLTAAPIPVPVHRSKTVTRMILRLIHTVMIVWGVLVVKEHIYPIHDSHGPVAGCQLEFRSWQSLKRPCAVLQINCHAHGQAAGTSDGVATILARLESRVLRHIVFSHCLALEIPPEVVQQFPNLNAIGIFNSTIHKWDAGSSLTRQYTPTLTKLEFFDTNMSAIPDGLLHDQLPRGINLILHNSNLRGLPANIGMLWGSVRWTTLWIENAQLQELPASFSLLQISKLSLEGNPISSLPEDLFVRKQYRFLRFSQTQLTSLPTVDWDTSKLTLFLADETKLTSVPRWLRAWTNGTVDAKRGVSLYGAPVCDNGTDAEREGVLCGVIPASQRNEVPYEVIAAQRPLQYT